MRRSLETLVLIVTCCNGRGGRDERQRLRKSDFEIEYIIEQVKRRTAVETDKSLSVA